MPADVLCNMPVMQAHSVLIRYHVSWHQAYNISLLEVHEISYAFQELSLRSHAMAEVRHKRERVAAVWPHSVRYGREVCQACLHDTPLIRYQELCMTSVLSSVPKSIPVHPTHGSDCTLAFSSLVYLLWCNVHIACCIFQV